MLENAPPVQIRKNNTASARLPSLSTIHPSEGRIDFARGFGLEIPEEEEPAEEEQQDHKQDESDRDVTQDMEIDEDGDQTDHSVSHRASSSRSKHHSKQASKFSTHLSLGSFGGSDLAPSILHREDQGSLDVQEEKGASHIATDDVDAIGEWTATDSSDDGEVR